MLEQLLHTYLHDRARSLAHNDFFIGGLLLLVVGMVGAILHSALQLLLTRVRRAFIVSVEVRKQDEAYNWIMKWLAANTSAAGNASGTNDCRELSVFTTREYRAEQWRINSEESTSRPTVHWAPAPGLHVYRFRNHWISVRRTMEDRVIGVGSVNHAGEVHEVVQLSTFGRDPKILKELIGEAMKMVLSDEVGKTLIFQPRIELKINGQCSWKKVMALEKRPLESVHLECGVIEKLVSQVRDFLSKRDWYRRRGIPHRRGFLLYGPPGCGKSSFAAALAGELDLNLCVCSLAATLLNDEDLQEYLRRMPRGSILLLEDIDAAFASREQEKKQGLHNYTGNTVTLSGLLNALDGVVAFEGSIVLMTTNHREKLDPALTRPGRVDVAIHVGLAKRDQIKRLFTYFYRPWEMIAEAEDASRTDMQKAIDLRKRVNQVREEIGALAEQFAMLIPEDRISMASVQGYLLNYKDDHQAALDHAEKFIAQELIPTESKESDAREASLEEGKDD